MEIPFFDLKRQHEKIKDEIDNSINEVFQNSHFILGKKGEKFEEEFSSWTGMPYGIGVNSGTDALHLALLAVDIQEGDEVITVPNTAIPTVSAIIQAKAKPVFVDVNEDNLLIDTSKIEAAITSKTKAILPVHLYGQCCDMESIIQIAKKHNLKIIEDCAQAHGAEYNGKKAGSFGDISCFSFYPTKNLGAYGDAGMILCKDEAIYKKLIMLRQYGEDKRYHSVINGFNSRLDEIQANILLVKLKYLNEWNEKRKNIASTYFEGLNNEKITPIMHVPGSVFHLFVIQTENRNKLQEYLKLKEITTMIHYPTPLHLQPVYASFGYSKGDFPVAEEATKRILSIPLFPELKEEEIKYIINTLNEY